MKRMISAIILSISLFTLSYGVTSWSAPMTVGNISIFSAGVPSGAGSVLGSPIMTATTICAFEANGADNFCFQVGDVRSQEWLEILRTARSINKPVYVLYEQGTMLSYQIPNFNGGLNFGKQSVFGIALAK